MTEEPKPTPSLYRRLREPAVLNYLIMTGAGLLAYGFVMVGRGNDVGAMLALVFALAGVLARWTASPVLILLLTAYLTIDPAFLNLIGWFGGSPWFFPRPPVGFNVEDLIMAAGLLAYSIGHFRLLSILHEGMRNEPTVQREPSKVPPRRPARLIGTDEVVRTLIVGGICVVVAQIAWWTMVGVEKSRRPYATSFSPGLTRFVMYAWIVGLLLLFVSAALVYLRGARMTRQEASLSLREEFFQENRRETDRIQRWRRWFKEKVAIRRRSGK